LFFNTLLIRDGLMVDGQPAPACAARGVARVDRSVSDYLET
jgi:hypothetical protein